MSVATSYAKALFEATKESNGTAKVLDEIEKQIELFEKILSSSKELKTALLGPLANVKEKTTLISEVCKSAGISQAVTLFLSLLARKGRLSLLAEIRDAYSSARLAAEGGISAKLVAADPMNESDVQSLAEAFGKKLGKKVSFRIFNDPALLAGMKVTVNGVTYDGSLRSQIQRLRDQFVRGYRGQA